MQKINSRCFSLVNINTLEKLRSFTKKMSNNINTIHKYKDLKSSSTSDDVHNPKCLHQNQAWVRYIWARMRRHLVFHCLRDPKMNKKWDGFRLIEAIIKVLNFRGIVMLNTLTTLRASNNSALHSMLQMSSSVY